MSNTLLFIAQSMLALLLIASPTSAAAPAGVDLANSVGWDIVVDAAAVPSERYAAEEIQHYFQPSDLDAELKGRMLPLVREFFSLCEAHGVTRVSEQRTVAQAKQRLSEQFELADGEEF